MVGQKKKDFAASLENLCCEVKNRIDNDKLMD